MSKNEKPSWEEDMKLLLDKDAIRDVISRYAFNVDLGRMDNILRLWTDDAEFITDAPGETIRIKGKSELRRFFLDAPERFKPAPQHLQIDLVITINADKAYAAGYQVIIVGRDNSFVLERCGFRAFYLIRVDDRWFINKTISRSLENRAGCKEIIPEEW